MRKIWSGDVVNVKTRIDPGNVGSHLNPFKERVKYQKFTGQVVSIIGTEARVRFSTSQDPIDVWFHIRDLEHPIQ